MERGGMSGVSMTLIRRIPAANEEKKRVTKAIKRDEPLSTRRQTPIILSKRGRLKRSRMTDEGRGCEGNGERSRLYLDEHRGREMPLKIGEKLHRTSDDHGMRAGRVRRHL